MSYGSKAVPVWSGPTRPANSYPVEGELRTIMPYSPGPGGNQRGRTNLDGGLLQPQSGSAILPTLEGSDLGVPHLPSDFAEA